MIRDYYSQLVDRAVKSAAQAAVLSIGVESAQVDAFAVDFALMGGMALGGALLSILTTVGARGIFGRSDSPVADTIAARD